MLIGSSYCEGGRYEEGVAADTDARSFGATAWMEIKAKERSDAHSNFFIPGECIALKGSYQVNHSVERRGGRVA